MPFTKRKRILNFGYRCAIDLKIKIYLTPTVQFKKETNIKNVIMLAATVIFLLLSRYIYCQWFCQMKTPILSNLQFSVFSGQKIFSILFNVFSFYLLQFLKRMLKILSYIY